MRDKFDFALKIGTIETPNGMKYMIAYQAGIANPLFYIDMATKPTLLAQDYERPFPASVMISNSVFDQGNFEKSQVGEEALREQAYHLNILASSGNPPKCGKPKDPPPSSPAPTNNSFPTLVDQELKMFSAQLETTMSGSELIQKMQTENKCVSALQVFGKNFQSFSKLTINPVVTGSGVNSNNLEGRTLRNICSQNTVIALTSLSESLKLNGLKSYVMKINTTVAADYPVDQVIIHPSMVFLKEQNFETLPLRENLKVAPYVQEVVDYGDYKSITAYVPLADLVDCGAVLAKGKELAPQYPNISYAKSFELMGVFNTDLKYNFKYVNAEGESDGCEGSGPIKSPLLISFDPKGEVSTQSDSIKFDVNGDGADENVAGWPTKKSKTAFLVLKHKGKISGKFLFGNATDLSNLGLGVSFADGHEALAQLDVNKDGVLDKNDKIGKRPVLSFLELWFDHNGNGKEDRGERKSIERLGRISVGLKVLSTPEKVIKGAGSITTFSEVSFGAKIKLPIYDLWYKVQ
jgi:hypothetical protein